MNTAILPRWCIPFRLVERVRAFRPDIVHIFKPKSYAGLVQWLLWQRRRVGDAPTRIILDTDDWEGAGGWNDLEPYSTLQKRFFAWQEKWGLHHADAVTVASRALESIVWSLGVPRERVLYLPNGSSSLPRATEPPSRAAVRQSLGLGDTPVILLYTRFFEYDLIRAVDILSRVFGQLPEAKLLLVGKGLLGQEKKFLEMASARGWRERVVDAGWVEMAALPGYFAVSDVAIFPFDDTLVNRCKCSVKLIDLLANGVPVVAEAVGQVQEYIRHDETGVLVTPGDIDGFARSVLDLLQDGEKRARLGRCAQSRILRDYDWAKLAERVEKTYHGSI